MRELSDWLYPESVGSEAMSDSESDYDERYDEINLLHKAYIVAKKISTYGM